MQHKSTAPSQSHYSTWQNYVKKIKLFSMSPIPSIYKTDNTDRILFVETVCFDVCKALLNNKRLSEDHVREIMTEYSRYLEQTDLSEFNDYALQHFNTLTDIMELFVKTIVHRT